MEREGNEEILPPGFRFHPTDEELITYYLVNKISDSSFTGRAIGDVDLNKSEPWELPGIYFHFIYAVLRNIRTARNPFVGHQSNQVIVSKLVNCL